MSLNIKLVPCITGILEQLDGQRPGLSLYDVVENSPFFPKPRVNELDAHGTYRWVTYESRNGLLRYKSKICPNKWTTSSEVLVVKIPEPFLEDGQYTADSYRNQCYSIITMKVGGQGVISIEWDLSQGRHLIPFLKNYRLQKNRNHEWNYCWNEEDPKTFFDRGDFDEIWKAMQLLKISVDRVDPEHKMRNKWWARRTVGPKVFEMNLKHGDGTPLVAD